MTYRVFLSGHLKNFSNGITEIAILGEHGTVADLLKSLWDQQKALRDRILNEQGEIREHVNIFYDGRDVRRLDGLETKIAPDSELHIFNAISGG